MSLYIGLMSGTSMDGIDTVLVDITDTELLIIGSATYPYPPDLRAKLLDAIAPEYIGSLHEFATLNIEVGKAFAGAALTLIETTETDATTIRAIGSHGQTLRHSPRTSPPYSLQIGDGPTIAAQTKITTVNDFRGLDVAAGGEGAPLVPAFHEWLFRQEQVNRVVLNIGGIANVTCVTSDSGIPITGFDTGPGNCLMDEWCQKHLGKPYDLGGQWASQGVVSEILLEVMSNDPYFDKAIPKSTGREYFNAAWLDEQLRKANCGDLAAVDVQATLLALTAITISDHIRKYAPRTHEVLVCGGGVFNKLLMSHLQSRLPGAEVISTATQGADPEMIEATSFAWFAHRRLHCRPVKLTTGETSRQLLLGALHSAPKL